MTVELTLNIYIYIYIYTYTHICIYCRYIMMYGGNDKICGTGFKIFYCNMGSRCGCSTAKSVSKIRFNIDNHWSDMEGFLGGSVVKNACKCRSRRFNPCVGKIPWSSNPLQYSCLENPMDRGAWRAIVHGVTKEPDATDRLNNGHELHGGYMGGY